jgi:hypothetical protein
MPGNRTPDHLQVWIDARKKFHLSHAQVQMARELGFNPKKLGKLANHKQEPWKMPLPQFIEHLYRKQCGRDRPAVVMSIEEKVEMERLKKLAKRARKQTPREQTIETCEELKLRNQEINR